MTGSKRILVPFHFNTCLPMHPPALPYILVCPINSTAWPSNNCGPRASTLDNRFILDTYFIDFSHNLCSLQASRRKAACVHDKPMHHLSITNVQIGLYTGLLTNWLALKLDSCPGNPPWLDKSFNLTVIIWKLRELRESFKTPVNYWGWWIDLYWFFWAVKLFLCYDEWIHGTQPAHLETFKSL